MMRSIFLVLLVALLGSATPVEKRASSTYSPVTLQNQASFSVRQMNEVSLESLLTTFLNQECGVLGAACTDFLTTSLSKILPSITAIESLNGQGQSTASGSSASANGNANLDLLLQLLTFPPTDSLVNEIMNTTLGVEILPSTAIAYFTANAMYNASFSAANVNLETQAFALFQSYSAVIEFHDSNLNNLYDQGEAVQTYNLGAQAWESASVQTVSVGSATVYQVTASTQDGVVSFNCQTASYPVLDSFGQVISPNATKCTISINNFPFAGKSSLLAIVANTVLIGAKFSSSATGQLTNFQINVGNVPNTVGGQFSWVPTANVSSTSSFKVAAVGSAGASNGVVDLATRFILSASGSTTTDVKNIVFTFQSGVNPSQVIWDPTVTYGSAPAVAQPTQPASSSAAALSASFFLLLLSCLVVLLF